jgi:hypothetical protein
MGQSLEKLRASARPEAHPTADRSAMADAQDADDAERLHRKRIEGSAASSKAFILSGAKSPAD